MERCDECKRKISDDSFLTTFYPKKYALPAQDYGASHFFCQDCLDALEIEQAKELGQWIEDLPLQTS